MADKKPNPAKKNQYTEGICRRRQATARVRIYPLEKLKNIVVGDVSLEKGTTIVNGVRIPEYFPGSIYERVYNAPFRITNTLGVYAVTAKVAGGGIQGQLHAYAHGISRALSLLDKEKYHQTLKKRGLLTRDPRTRERRKAGLAQKARAKKQSPKR